MGLETGLIVKSTGSWYQIRTNQHQILEARIKGKFRIDSNKTTNPVAVGDIVDYEIEDSGKAIISKIHTRKNYIIRKSVNLSKQGQIIAANIDQAFLMISLKNPTTSFGFVDRFLATAEAYEVKVILVFNKVDLLDDETFLNAWVETYEKIGYKTINISALNNQNIENLKLMMQGNVNLVSGHSGVGKSTLINQLNHQLDLRTNEISDYHQKGQHTTTFAEMFSIDNNTYVIDTPGIKGFGVVDMKKELISHYFVEMAEMMGDCKFNNCTHINEPKCAVLDALQNGEIAESRYKSYLSIYQDDEKETYRTVDY